MTRRLFVQTANSECKEVTRETTDLERLRQLEAENSALEARLAAIIQENKALERLIALSEKKQSGVLSKNTPSPRLFSQRTTSETRLKAQKTAAKQPHARLSAQKRPR